MIKFRCDACEKKIGVPVGFAGKVVRCPQCKEPAKVPIPTPPAQAAPVREPDPQDNQLIWSDDLLKTEQQRPAVGAVANLSSGPAVRGVTPRGPAVVCPRCATKVSADSEFCINCGGPMPAPGKVHGGSTAGGGLLTGIAGFPLALGAGFAVAAICAMGWAFLAMKTQFEFGFLAWLIGVIIGGVMLMFARNQSALLGIFAAGFAILSIVLGKYYIAKWVIIPEFDKGFAAAKNEAMNEIVNNDELMIGHLAMLEAAEGKISESEYANIEYLLFPDDEQVSSPDNMTQEDYAQAQAHIVSFKERVKTLDRAQRLDMVEEKINREIDNNAGEIESMKHEATMAAFKELFSPFDILWAILAVGSAFKVTYGKGD